MEPLEASARENYRLWLRYDDGACGEVDLSHLVGQGVFAAWSDPAFYQTATAPFGRGDGKPPGGVGRGDGESIRYAGTGNAPRSAREAASPPSPRPCARGDRESRARPCV